MLTMNTFSSSVSDQPWFTQPENLLPAIEGSSDPAFLDEHNFPYSSRYDDHHRLSETPYAATSHDNIRSPSQHDSMVDVVLDRQDSPAAYSRSLRGEPALRAQQFPPDGYGVLGSAMVARRPRPTRESRRLLNPILEDPSIGPMFIDTWKRQLDEAAERHDATWRDKETDWMHERERLVSEVQDLKARLSRPKPSQCLHCRQPLSCTHCRSRDAGRRVPSIPPLRESTSDTQP